MKIEHIVGLALVCLCTGCVSSQIDRLEELRVSDEGVRLGRDAQVSVLAEVLKTDDVSVWNKGVELVADEDLLTEIAISAHAFGEVDGRIQRSVLSAGLRAVEKLTKKAHIEKVYESARANEVRNAAKAMR